MRQKKPAVIKPTSQKQLRQIARDMLAAYFKGNASCDVAHTAIQVLHAPTFKGE